MRRNLQLFAHDAARSIFSNDDPSILVGAGSDDVAVLECGEEKLLISSDFVNHSRIQDVYSETDFYSVGQYCVRQNASDILGSGGTPRWFIFSVVLERGCSEDDVRNLFSGVEDECKELGMSVIGGDTKQGKTTTIHGTIIGTTDNSPWAKGPIPPNSDVYVTGPLSGVTAALTILEFSKSKELKKRALDALAAATLPIDCLSRVMAERLTICASDISDGLGFTLHEFMRVNSELSLEVLLDNIPLHPLVKDAASELGVDELSFCFGIGGDFQVAMVAKAGDRQKLEAAGAVRIGKFSSGTGSNAKVGSQLISPVPSFGHLDFEQKPTAQRFREFAEAFSESLNYR